MDPLTDYIKHDGINNKNQWMSKCEEKTSQVYHSTSQIKDKKWNGISFETGKENNYGQHVLNQLWCHLQAMERSYQKSKTLGKEDPIHSG